MEKISYDAKLFGKRLKVIRKQNNMTQAKLAERLLLSEDTISNIENGKTTCMPEHLVQMCQIFNVSADYFYFDIMKELMPSSNNMESIISQLQECSDFDLSRVSQMIQILLSSPNA